MQAILGWNRRYRYGQDSARAQAVARLALPLTLSATHCNIVEFAQQKVEAFYGVTRTRIKASLVTIRSHSRLTFERQFPKPLKHTSEIQT